MTGITEPLVSIVITDYNYARYIGEAIESAIRQGYPHREIIIINDGSTDDSDAVVQDYLGRESAIRYYKQDNQGIVATRNRGLALAKGDFICFLDADNTLPEDYIQRLVEQATAESADVVYTDLALFGEAAHVIHMPEFDFEELKAHNFVDMAALIRISAVGDLRFDPNLSDLSHEDWDFFLGLAFSGVKFQKNPDVMLNYRIHEGSRNSLDSVQYAEDSLRYVKLSYYLVHKYQNLYPGQIDFSVNSELVQYLTRSNTLASENSKLETENAELRQENTRQISKNIKLRFDNEQFKVENLSQQQSIQALNARIDGLLRSKRYRVGRFLAAPLTIARHLKHEGPRRTAGWVRDTLRGGGAPAAVNVEAQKSSYQRYIAAHYPPEAVLNEMRAVEFVTRPMFSIIMPTYNTDERFLKEAIESVLHQAYENWELIIVDDASTKPGVREILSKYANADTRIRTSFSSENSGIAGATNTGIAMARGEFVSLFDHDDLLWPNALFEVAKSLNSHPQANLIYTDEDKVDEDSDHHFEPFFKPDWNPDLLRGANYITHFTTIRKEALDLCGYESGEYNGAQDWELILRVTRQVPRDSIIHVPEIVYSWRASSSSTAQSVEAKPYVRESQLRAVKDDLVVRGYEDATVERDDKGLCQVRYSLRGKPLISIVIPTKNQYQVVRRCIESIFARTRYDNFEVILVDTGSDEPDLEPWYAALSEQHDNFHLHRFVEDAFSYSRSCNYGAHQAAGELLVQLNNDTEVISPDWLEVLGAYAQRPEIGAVSPLLYYPGNKLIQHAGVGIGVGGPGASANNLFAGCAKQAHSVIQNVMLNTTRDSTAVTAACLMIDKKKFFEIEGFAEEFRVTFNDVDLCLKLWEKGYYNVYTPLVQLTHHESLSIGVPHKKNRDVTELLAADRLFKQRWAGYVANDPNYNINLNKQRCDFTL